MAVEHKVSGVLGGYFTRFLRVVGLFLVQGYFAGNFMVFHPDIAPDSVGVEVRFDIVVIQIVTEVAVEFAVARVAGIAGFGTPNLLCRFHIAGKGGYTRLRAIHRSINAVFRARGTVQDAV